MSMPGIDFLIQDQSVRAQTLNMFGFLKTLKVFLSCFQNNKFLVAVNIFIADRMKHRKKVTKMYYDFYFIISVIIISLN